MSWLLSLQLAIPLGTAALAFLTRYGAGARWISVAGSALQLLAALVLFSATWRAGVVSGQMGGWPAPFGITLVTDLLSAVMVVITAVISLAVAIFAIGEIDALREKRGYHALFQILILGVTGAFITGDLFNLYVWFEVMLIASFGLLVLGGSREEVDGGVKYVCLNLVSTVLFLTGTGMLYGMAGTLNMADLAVTVDRLPNRDLVDVVAMLFMVAFGVKAALFPLFFWLPASYHVPTFSISAVFAGLLTKVGVYALIRCFTMIFDADIGFTHQILLWVAVMTMITGVLGAAAQGDFRRVLSFHIVSQIGYMVLGLALMTPLAIMGAVFYLVHHIIVKANLFLVAGMARRLAGSTDLYRIGGLYAAAPLLAALFLVPAFSLAGFPPLSGFWAKFLVVKASMEAQHWLVAAAALAVGFMTIFSMTKIWAEAFWKPHPEGGPEGGVRRLSDLPRAGRLSGLIPISGLAALTLVIGLWPGPFLALAERSAGQLLDPGAYVSAVLGESGATADTPADTQPEAEGQLQEVAP